MAATGPPPSPRNFYLNEQHETTGERGGGGNLPHYPGIDWVAKGERIGASIDRASAALRASRDPLRENRYFLLARPEGQLRHESKSRRATGGLISEMVVDLAGARSRAIERLQLDLVQAAPDGTAVVHGAPARIAQLARESRELAGAGARQQARLAPFAEFDVVPSEFRIEAGWLASVGPAQRADAVIELQPMLTRVEIEAVLDAIRSFLKLEDVLSRSGSDFSGRYWVRGDVRPTALRAVAENLFSVQAVHSPLVATAARARTARARDVGPPADPRASSTGSADLPTVAILDTGVPAAHRQLAPYRRGSWILPASTGSASGDHGSRVASRVVFGDLDGAPAVLPRGTCGFYDVLVSQGPMDIDEKGVSQAIEAVIGAAPDVRVFNLSFDTRPLEQIEQVKRQQGLFLLQDLDNLAFQYDILPILAAGNADEGFPPAPPYPTHQDHALWQLGTWARSFNGLTCGSFVHRLIPGGLAQQLGWPSPFTRVGPGIANSPKPDFSAPGGDCTREMRFQVGLGVWCLGARGLWEDHPGTSYSAPLLAREAAFAFRELQRVCERGAVPYAVLVKAVLALLAVPHNVRGAAEALAIRALGRGQARADPIGAPRADRAIVAWQGALRDSAHAVRVQIPVPREWVKAANQPKLRLVVCWDPPVNAAAPHLWATRSVAATLRLAPGSPAARARGTDSSTYPWIDRSYRLRPREPGHGQTDDWVYLELGYEELCPYPVGRAFAPAQRVAFAAELRDHGEAPLSPQGALQALPAAATMVRLTVPPRSVPVPTIVAPSL